MNKRGTHQRSMPGVSLPHHHTKTKNQPTSTSRHTQNTSTPLKPPHTSSNNNTNSKKNFQRRTIYRLGGDGVAAILQPGKTLALSTFNNQTSLSDILPGLSDDQRVRAKALQRQMAEKQAMAQRQKADQAEKEEREEAEIRAYYEKIARMDQANNAVQQVPSSEPSSAVTDTVEVSQNGDAVHRLQNANKPKLKRRGPSTTTPNRRSNKINPEPHPSKQAFASSSSSGTITKFPIIETSEEMARSYPHHRQQKLNQIFAELAYNEISASSSITSEDDVGNIVPYQKQEEGGEMTPNGPVWALVEDLQVQQRLLKERLVHQADLLLHLEQEVLHALKKSPPRSKGSVVGRELPSQSSIIPIKRPAAPQRRQQQQQSKQVASSFTEGDIGAYRTGSRVRTASSNREQELKQQQKRWKL